MRAPIRAPIRALIRGRLLSKLALVLAASLGWLGAARAQQPASSAVPQGVAQAVPQIDPLVAEAQGWLTDLVRINTSPSAVPSPSAAPGSAGKAQDSGEVAAAKYVAQILQKENINTELVQLAPGSAVVVARMQAGPLPNPASALLLVAHLDVAPVTRSKWTVDPFAGTVRDGYIYGRGVVDDKGMVAVNLAAMVALKRSGARLTRDVIFLADAGSQPGNPAGMKSVAERFWDKIACGFAINEGGDIPLENGKVQYVGVQAGEKVPYDVAMVASGTPGPAALPGSDDAVTHLAAAIAKIGAMETPAQLMTLTRRYFEALAPIEDEDTAKWIRALETERFSLAVIRLTEMSPEWGAMLHDTVAPTELEASSDPELIPSEARANLHVQVLPGNPIGAIVAQMEKTVADPKIKLQVNPDSGVAAPESSLESALYQSIARVAPEQFPGAAVVPMLSPEATGSAELRLRNVQAYGLFPFPLSQADARRREGDDERLPLSSFRAGLEFLYRTVYDFAAAH